MAELMIDGPEVAMAVHELGRVARHVLREGRPMRPSKSRPKVTDGEES